MGFMSEEGSFRKTALFRGSAAGSTVTELPCHRHLLNRIIADIPLSHRDHRCDIRHRQVLPIVKKAYDRYLEIRKEVYGERIAEKDITLMDLAVIGTKYVKLGLADDLDESEEINACSINVTAEIDGKKRLAGHVQNETHNHPTKIRPFGGAATCLGGRSAIRFPGVSMCTKRCA